MRGGEGRFITFVFFFIDKKGDKCFNNMKFYYHGPEEDLKHDDPIVQENRKKIIKGHLGIKSKL